LAPDQQKRIAEVLSNKGRASEVVCEGFSVELKREDIWCLNPGEWLNDEVHFLLPPSHLSLPANATYLGDKFLHQPPDGTKQRVSAGENIYI
jgi:hypothetical protein